MSSLDHGWHPKMSYYFLERQLGVSRAQLSSMWWTPLRPSRHGSCCIDLIATEQTSRQVAITFEARYPMLKDEAIQHGTR